MVDGVVDRILSIERNAILAKELRFLKRIVRGFDYRIAAAGGRRPETGDRRGSITMYVTFCRGVALTAYTASSREDVMDERGGLHDWLGDRMRRPDFHVEEVTAEVVPLDDLDLSPAFVKIDVEGSELRGAARARRHARALSADPHGRAQRRLRSDPAAPGVPRLLGVGLSGRRRAVRSLPLRRRRSQRVLHASRGDPRDA